MTTPAQHTAQAFIDFSFDGHGVNDWDEYRTRLATLTEHGQKRNVGPLLTAAPDLYLACKEALRLLEHLKHAIHPMNLGTLHDLQTALARAEQPNPTAGKE